MPGAVVASVFIACLDILLNDHSLPHLTLIFLSGAPHYIEQETKTMLSKTEVLAHIIMMDVKVHTQTEEPTRVEI